MFNQPNRAIIEDTKLIFRNFSGRPTKFNPNGGKRTVGVIIPTSQQAAMLKANGWNVKELAPREEGDDSIQYVNANIKYGIKPPHIVMVVNGRKADITEETVGTLDNADIISVDVVLNPYISAMGNGTITAYVKDMYVNVEPDVFANKYSNVGNNSMVDVDSDEMPF